MSRVFVLMLVAGLLTACNVPNTPETIGEHNLSKGRCENIPTCQGEECRAVKDESVQYVCEMVGGTFVPREHRWF